MDLNLPAAGVMPVGRHVLLGRWSWALFDGARIPDNVLVNIFVFSAYFSTVVISDPVHGQVVWSYTSAVGAILVAIGAPILGAIADAGGRRKPWLVGVYRLWRAQHGGAVVCHPRHERRPGMGHGGHRRQHAVLRVFGHFLQRHAAEHRPAGHRLLEWHGLRAGQCLWRGPVPVLPVRVELESSSAVRTGQGPARAGARRGHARGRVDADLRHAAVCLHARLRGHSPGRWARRSARGCTASSKP